ncbi:hypothetical protein [Brachybacterium sp. AOP3-A1-3]|uniref:hypothetical protein n=1 Tax=Brachybacterium sp. AOP3-A1-3 TaxID=3457699 RepID=UPI0040342866
MSRRRRDDRTDRERESDAQWRTLRVLCSGRGTHGHEVMARLLVHEDDIGSLTLADLPSLTAGEVEAMVSVDEGRAPDPVPHYREDGTPGGVHFTRTFRCSRCGRTVPLREEKFTRRALALIVAGARHVDISRLDRVRLT